MTDIYYLAQMITDNIDYDFVGVFTTRKNAEDAVCDILTKKYDKTIHYTDYSAEADFLEEHSNEYMVNKIEINKNYY